MRRAFRLSLAAATAIAFGAAPTAAARSPRSLDHCIHAGRYTKIVRVAVSHGDKIDAAVLGRGRVGVVLANQSDRNLCAWRSFARTLERAHFRVLLFDYGYGGVEPWVEVAAAVHELRRLGTPRVFLLGASEGAKASIVAAAKHAPVRGVVSLSAERYLGRIDVEPWAAKLRQPILFVTALADPYAETDTPSLYQACGSTDKTLFTVPGAAHGVVLLHGTASSSLDTRILAFLRSHT
jgi:pimeloyl-ACP methyl ester carboxylesterase